ncbi:MAG: hypothetical protein AB7N76_32995 [Planctomycetota bacterium]
MKTTRIHLMLAAALLAGGVAQAQSSTQLHWKFEKGKVRTEISRSKVHMSMDMMGQTMEVAQDQTYWTVAKIVDVDAEGTATVERSIKRVLMYMDNPQLGKFTIDTDKKEDPEGPAAMVAGQVRGLVGGKITYKMKATGEISDVKVDDALAAGSGGANLEQLAKQSAVTFPADLSVGKTFETKADMAQGPMTMRITSTYTYKGKHKGLEKFDCGQKMEIVPDPNMPMQMKIGKQSSEGEYLFDAAKGWVDRVKVRMNMVMEIAGPQGAITQDMEVVSDTRVVEGEDTKATVGDEDKKSEGGDEKKSDGEKPQKKGDF